MFVFFEIDYIISIRKVIWNVDMICTYFDFEGVSVIGVWCEISMYFGTVVEWFRVGVIIIESKVVSVICII